MKKHNMITLGVCLFLTSLSHASPLHPWDSHHCTELKQEDGKKIGSVCSRMDFELQIGIVDVYYFGYLYENQNDYLGFYANVSLEGLGFHRRYMKKFTSGDGNNLPKREVMHAVYYATTHLNSVFPEGKGFRAYFQAEEKPPTKHNPPFSYDSNLEKNYTGKLKNAN